MSRDNANNKMATRSVGPNGTDSGSAQSEDMSESELSSIPFCELQKVREKIGTKEFDTLLLSPESKWHKKHNSPRTVPSSGKRRRVDKSKPLEISSKKRVPYLKKPVPVAEQPSQRPVDPRFNEKCGNLNESLFEKSYHFLSEVRAKEKHLVKQELKKEKDEEKRAELSRLLNKMDSRDAAQMKAKQKKNLQREHNKIERAQQKSGKRPFYLKKSVSRKIDLVQKYKKLKKEGKLEKFMQKKRKRNAQRDRKQLPI